MSEFDPDELVEIQMACVFDMCEMGNDIVLSLCPTAEQFAQRCQQDLHVNISNWRGQDFCRRCLKQNEISAGLLTRANVSSCKICQHTDSVAFGGAVADCFRP